MSIKTIINEVPKISMKNRTNLEQVDKCCCYSCLNIFNTNEITQWTDNSQTALCPKCNIDAVLPQIIDLNDLKIIHDYWFGEIKN